MAKRKYFLVVGKIYGRLRFIGDSPKKQGGRLAGIFQCICGAEKVIALDSVAKGLSTSCGCYQSERVTETRTVHGMSRKRLYKIWLNMRSRCDNPNATNYHRYGGRGIRYSDLFRTFDGFLANIPEGYTDSLELDRIDNDRNYEPGNLRWATRRMQSNNTRRNVVLDDPIDGGKMTLTELAVKYGVRPGRLDWRLSHGWDIKKAITTPVDERSQVVKLSDEKVREINRTLGSHSISDTAILCDVPKTVVQKIYGRRTYNNVKEFG